MLKYPGVNPLSVALAVEAVAIAGRLQKEWSGYGVWGKAGRLCPPDITQERSAALWQDGWSGEVRASLVSAVTSALVQRMIRAPEDDFGGWSMHPAWEATGSISGAICGIVLDEDCSSGIPASILDEAEKAKANGLSVWLIVSSAPEVWKSLGEQAFRQSLDLGVSWWFRWPSPSQEQAWLLQSNQWCQRWVTDNSWDQWCWPFTDALLRRWVEGVLGTPWHERTPNGLSVSEWTARTKQLLLPIMYAHYGEQSWQDLAVGLTLWAQSSAEAPAPLIETSHASALSTTSQSNHAQSNHAQSNQGGADEP
jgi:hypothetical protein